MAEDEIVRVVARTPTTTEASARGHVFVQDKPKPTSGDEGPMASEYLLGALGSCTITTAYKVAAKRGRRIDALVVTARGSFEDGLFSKIHLGIEIKGDGAMGDWDTVFRLVERICTVSRALSVPITRTVMFG